MFYYFMANLTYGDLVLFDNFNGNIKGIITFLVLVTLWQIPLIVYFKICKPLCRSFHKLQHFWKWRRVALRKWKTKENNSFSSKKITKSTYSSDLLSWSQKYIHFLLKFYFFRSYGIICDPSRSKSKSISPIVNC